ncbi:MAG: type II toxin-antitoxin system prevent-host-death family antitoxin [Bryobacteraceae bacterium]|jgi:prevent-host-death family protein
MPGLVVNATDFKAKCLAILDDVDTNGITVTVTKRGRPVATIRPAADRSWKPLKGTLAGKVRIPDDILEADRSDLWDAVRGK